MQVSYPKMIKATDIMARLLFKAYDWPYWISKEDIKHAAIVKILHKKPDHGAYYICAKNAMIDYIREIKPLARSKKTKIIVENLIDDDSEIAKGRMRSHIISDEETENRVILQNIISKMTYTEKKYFILKYIKGYSSKEIACKEKVKLNTVSVTLCLAKRKIRKRYN